MHATTLNPVSIDKRSAQDMAARTHKPVIGFIWGVAIDDLENEWRDLETDAANPLPFNGFDFLWHWRAVFCVGKNAAKPFVVTVRDNGRLVALLPMMLIQFGPVRICEWMGEPLSEYGDALVRRGYNHHDWLDEAVSRLAGCPQADVFFLRKVRADAVIAPSLDAIMPASNTRQAPVIDLSAVDGMSGLHARLSSNLRKEMRRKRKRLDGQGHVSFSIARAGPEATAVMERALVFKRAWLENRKAASRALTDSRTTTFLNRLSADERRGRGLVLSELAVDGISAAIEAGFISGNCYYAFLGTYNPDLSDLGPGLVQMDDTIAWCVGEGLDAYDLFAPADAYKLRWTDLCHDVNDHAHARSLAGHAFRIWLAYLRPFLKRCLEALPVSARTPLTALLSRG